MIIEKKTGWMKKISDLILPLCVYYLAGSVISVVGFTYLESKKEYFNSLTFGESNAFLLLSGAVRAFIYLFSALSVYGFYQKEGFFQKQKEEVKEEDTKETDDSYGSKNKVLKKTGIFASGAVLAVLFNLLWSMIPFFSQNQAYEEVAAVQYSVPLWFGIFLYGLASPLAEEIMFRGVTYRMGKRYFGKKTAVLLSSLIFGGFHGNPVQASYGILMGCFMALLYEKEGEFWAPFLFHSGANIAVYLIANLY